MKKIILTSTLCFLFSCVYGMQQQEHKIINLVYKPRDLPKSAPTPQFNPTIPFSGVVIVPTWSRGGFGYNGVLRNYKVLNDIMTLLTSQQFSELQRNPIGSEHPFSITFTLEVNNLLTVNKDKTLYAQQVESAIAPVIKIAKVANHEVIKAVALPEGFTSVEGNCALFNPQSTQLAVKITNGTTTWWLVTKLECSNQSVQINTSNDLEFTAETIVKDSNGISYNSLTGEKQIFIYSE